MQGSHVGPWAEGDVRERACVMHGSLKLGYAEQD